MRPSSKSKNLTPIAPKGVFGKVLVRFVDEALAPDILVVVLLSGTLLECVSSRRAHRSPGARQFFVINPLR